MPCWVFVPASFLRNPKAENPSGIIFEPGLKMGLFLRSFGLKLRKQRFYAPLDMILNNTACLFIPPFPTSAEYIHIVSRHFRFIRGSVGEGLYRLSPLQCRRQRRQRRSSYYEHLCTTHLPIGCFRRSTKICFNEVLLKAVPSFRG